MDGASPCSQSALDQLLGRLAENEASAPTRQLALHAEFRLTHTGGGCVVWERVLGDGTALWIFTADADVAADPAEAAWMVRRQSLSDIGGLIEICEPLPFPVALELATALPSPIKAEGEASLVFDTVASFVAAHPPATDRP